MTRPDPDDVDVDVGVMDTDGKQWARRSRIYRLNAVLLYLYGHHGTAEGLAENRGSVSGAAQGRPGKTRVSDGLRAKKRRPAVPVGRRVGRGDDARTAPLTTSSLGACVCVCVVRSARCTSGLPRCYFIVASLGGAHHARVAVAARKSGPAAVARSRRRGPTAECHCDLVGLLVETAC